MGHHLQVSLHTFHETEAVSSIVRDIFGRRPVDPMKDLDVNLAAVHLGRDYDVKSRFVKNHLWKTAGQLFMG